MHRLNHPNVRLTLLTTVAGLSANCIASPTNASQLQSQGSLWPFVILVAAIIALTIQLIRNHRKQLALRSKLQQMEFDNLRNVEVFTRANQQFQEEVSRHESTESLLRETQDYLHSIINSMPSVIIGVTAEGMVTHWNKVAERHSGIPAVKALGRPLIEVFPPATLDKSHIQKIIDQGEPFINENYQYEVNGKPRYFDITIYPLSSSKAKGAVVRVDDVTFRVHVENRLIQNEKMLSLGELAAGMAHEINNPLSAVIQSAQNLQRRMSTELAANQETAKQLDIALDSVVAYLDERQIPQFISSIREAGERAAAIVANMLEFARFNSREHTLVDLPALIDNTLKLAASSFQLQDIHFKDIALTRAFPEEDFPKVSCSGVEIQQVLLNILRNAAQAVSQPEHRHNASLFIEVAETNGLAIISIKDNGAGMSEEVMKHIFEPFYTTKDIGEGTGLGLSVSYFIITGRHKGTIEVDSTLGKGTQFTLRLPIAGHHSKLD